MDHRGILVAIESNGYSQTNTVVKLLGARLQKVGLQTKPLHFPNKNEPSNYYVSQYQAGKYGDLQKSNTYIAALIYAMEHFDASKSLKESLDDKRIVLVRGYVGANLYRFGQEFSEAAERRGFYMWLENLEHTLMKIPRADKTYVLNINSPEKHQNIYTEIGQLFPKDYTIIDCTRDEKELAPEVVEDILWKTISSTQLNLSKQAASNAPDSNEELQAKTAKPLGLSSYMGNILAASASSFYMPKFASEEDKVIYSQGLIKLNKLQRNLAEKLTAFLAKSNKPDLARQKTLKTIWLVSPGAEITKKDIFNAGRLPNVNKKILDSLTSSGLGYGNDASAAKLQKHSPSNELDMLSHLLYSTTSLSSNDLRHSLDNLSFDKKNKLMSESLQEIKKSSLSALDNLDFSYTWEFLTSYGAYRYICGIIKEGHVVHQQLSPRYGYDTPELVDQAELNDDYEQCFNESLSIFSNLQAKGFEHEAQYLTLLGHKTRWIMTIDLFSLIRLMQLIKNSDETELKNLAERIIEEISPSQPLITEYLLS